MIIVELLQQLQHEADVRLEADAFSDRRQMFFADAAELRIMQQQVGQLSPLLDEMDLG